MHQHTSNINANVPNQNPFVGIPHNRLVFLHLYFDLLDGDEGRSVSYYMTIVAVAVLPYRTFGYKL